MFSPVSINVMLNRDVQQDLRIVTAVKKLLKKRIHILSVFIANIQTHLLRAELLATLLQLNSKDHIRVQKEKTKLAMACFIFDKM